MLVAWALVNALATLIHALDGSKGTKGNGWHGKGILVDIIGQGASRWLGTGLEIRVPEWR